MTKRVLKADTAEALWESEDGDAEDGWTRVHEDEGASRRWMKSMTLIVCPEGEPDELYGLDFQLGLTENQEHELPWRGGWGKQVDPDEPMPIYPMERYTKVTTYYRPKKASKP